MDFYRRTCLICGHCISNIFPGNTISKKKMLSRAVSKNNEGQGQRTKGTTVIMT